MGRTDSNAPGYAPGQQDDAFDPLIDDFVSKERKYLHFDRPLSEETRANVRATDDKILGNAFWPLLGFTKSERRTRRSGDEIRFENKDREIKFGSHADAALLEAYSRRLSHYYEASLARDNLGECVLAYRRNSGDNISQAKRLFDEIKSRGDATAIGIDIRKFFDRISHPILLDNIKYVLTQERLSRADYKVFKRMTTFEWVDSEKLNAALSGLERPHGRICSAKQFRDTVRSKNNLVEINKKKFGIPQGTPLSGLYANISLIKFDSEMKKFADSFGGYYLRYSDDIAIITPLQSDGASIVAYIDYLLSKIGLAVAEDKTLCVKFSFNGSKITSDGNFQYLGFTYDGNKILIRVRTH
jgi:hypothetical protein